MNYERKHKVHNVHCDSIFHLQQFKNTKKMSLQLCSPVLDTQIHRLYINLEQWAQSNA